MIPPPRKVRLHDLQVEDPITVGDQAIFEVRLTGQGYKDLTVPVVLKVRKTRRQGEGAQERIMVKVDPTGKSIKVRLDDQPREKGRRDYIVEVEPPRGEANEKPHPVGQPASRDTIEVIDTRQLKVLFVEGQPRYEFRFLKALLS